MTPTPKQWHRMALVALVVALVVWAVSAFAAERIVYPGTDRIELRAHETAVAEIVYHNAGPVTGSNPGTWLLELGGLTVTVRLQVGADETLTITPPPDLIALPDVLDVPDGETGTVLIVRPAF